MKGKVNLHTHSRKVSYDSTTPIRAMLTIYKSLGFDAVGFVGHDEFADVQDEELIIFNGNEITVSEDPEIHVVEYPEIGISFLAHPRRINKDDTKEVARDIISRENLDGVEKFNAGVKQYDGDINVTQFASDDAHNLFQIGTSFMRVEVEEITRGQFVQSITRGDIEMVNKRPRVIGEAVKSVNVLMGSKDGG